MAGEFQVSGENSAARRSLKLHRGDGMALLAMNWKQGKPPEDFVGFAIEYQEPGGTKFFSLKNRIAFPGAGGEINPKQLRRCCRRSRSSVGCISPATPNLDGAFIFASRRCS